MGLVFTVLALLLGLAVHFAVVRPILVLTAATERVTQGDLDPSVAIRTGDELEQLGERFNHMVGCINLMQEMALDASPLTGLPGNNSIAARVEQAIEAGQEMVVIYVDIDNFKAYNDVYGFEAGDRAILYTAEILDRVVRKQGGPDGFVGHVGGDDFILVVPEDRAAPVAKEICRAYGEKVASFYNETDVARGGIRTKDRQGEVQDFPFMSVSLAGVALTEGRFVHFGEIASTAAEVKKAAKAKDGSAFVMDRRSGRPGTYERHSNEEM